MTAPSRVTLQMIFVEVFLLVTQITTEQQRSFCRRGLWAFFFFTFKIFYYFYYKNLEYIKHTSSDLFVLPFVSRLKESSC